MSNALKLQKRLLLNPKDFTWDELTKVLASFGYTELKTGKTGGSRRKFMDDNKNIINLHKPHPTNILKTYAIKQVIECLGSKRKFTKAMNDILKYKDYYATVHYSAEDETFFGKIAGISDLVNFEGESVKELQVAFKEAVDDYLETCASVGKTPDKTYKGSFNVRISSELHKEAAYFSAANNLSLNDFIKKTVQYALENQNNFQGILQKP